MCYFTYLIKGQLFLIILLKDRVYMIVYNVEEAVNIWPLLIGNVFFEF